ncbi:cyclodeaminase/cyclohydrolase family protein [Microlunatus soli]|nr:cyclodeaminase/cyclohydrolase family protein [Microlunatus soli]
MNTTGQHGADPSRADSGIATSAVGELLARMADRRPGPAAGSAAALAAGLAAALTGKVARLSHRQLADAEGLAERADRLRERAVELADADAAAVVAMITGRGPEVDAGASAAGGAGTESGARDAAVVVPEEIGELAAELADLAKHLAVQGNPRLRADAVAAVRLAESARAIVHEIQRSNADAD